MNTGAMGRRLAVGVMLLLAAAGGAGCQSTPSVHGKEGVQAVYSAGTLTATLPEPVKTQQVMAAADQMFRDRGYSVVANSSTEDQGTISAVPPRDSLTPKVTIQARTTAGGVRVDVSVAPFGSKDLSSSMLDGILRRVGM